MKTGTPVTRRLSPAREALVSLFHDVGFGRIEGLLVRAGEPVASPSPRVIRTVRFGASEDTGATPSVEELATRPAVRQLMQQMDRMVDGRFMRIEIRQSSPVFSEIEITGTPVGGRRD